MDKDLEQPTVRKGKILVVDDEAKNREILAIMLESEGYEVFQAASGRETLKMVEENPPDAILLDLVMPDMTGIEVCRQLKSNPATFPIPILIITIVIEREDRLSCIEAGARDFLNKPIDQQDVFLRVKNAVDSKKLHDDMEASYLKLQELEQLRDSLTQMIVHDLKSPLTSIHGYLQLLEIHQQEMNENAKTDFNMAFTSTLRLIDMINDLLDLTHLESGKLKLNKCEFDIRETVRNATESMRFMIDEKEIELNLKVNSTNLFYDTKLIRRVLDNYMSNALKFSPQSGRITIKSHEINGFIRIEVIDEGPGLAPELYEMIFDKFKQAEMRVSGAGQSLGLGLAFCKLAVKAHGGDVGVDSTEGKGSTFWFSLPTLT